MSKLIKNTVIYTVGNVLTALSAFLLLPVYTKYMSVDDFGVTNSMQTLSGILIIIITLAIDRSLGRLYYDYADEKDRRDFLGTIFISLISIGIVATIICFISKDQLNKLFPNIPFYPYFTFSILYTFLLLIINYSQMIAQVKQNSKQFMFISLTLVVITASCNILLVVNYKEGAMGYVKGMMLSAAIIIPLVLYYIHKSINYTFNFYKLKLALIFSLPVLPSLLSSWILNLSDRIFINKYFTQTDVGIYSLGYRLASLIMFISAALFMAYNPVFFEIANREEISIEEKKEKLYKINSGIVLTVGILGLSILSGADILLKLFFRKEYITSYHYISIFALSFIISQIGALFNQMIYQNKKTQHVAIVIIICAVINIGLNYLLIPIGVYFAAINSLLCNILIFIFMYFLARKNFFIKTDWKIIGVILISYACIYFENMFLLPKDLIVSIPIKLLTILLMLFIFKNPILNVIKTIKNK